MVVVVRGSQLRMTYHAQRVALLWRGMMTLQRIGATLEPGPSSLVLYPKKLKINSRTVQGGGTGAGTRQEEGMTDGGVDIVE